MNPSLWHHHLAMCNCNRRGALGLAALTAVGALGGTSTGAAASDGDDRPVGRSRGGPALTDIPYDYANPANLADWAPGPYGPGDQRGAFNEVTPDKTGQAMRGLSASRGVKTYNLGELMFNGFPAFVTTPARGFQQRATATGFTPSPEFTAGGGFITSLTGLGTNSLSVMEERYPSTAGAPAGLTNQIGTQLDNLNHIGAGDFFYNGFKGPDIARSFGTVKLGGENMGPIVTRGVLLDILGMKIARGDRSALGAPAANGKPVLLDNYRITVEDIEAAMEFGGIRRLRPGDSIIFRTGWNQLLRTRTAAEFSRWGAAVGIPGIYLKEARWLARFRPAIVSSDTWALEVLGRPDLSGTTAFAVHQELIMRHGIRIGESVVSDGLAADRVYEFVYMISPQYAEGATCGNTAPVALAQPRH
jgi:kynurenine formamidase